MVESKRPKKDPYFKFLADLDAGELIIPSKIHKNTRYKLIK